MLLIIDSNSYLRIARELHPLLGRDYGDIPYFLNIHRDFDAEYSNDSRLQNKFTWVNDLEYLENRRNNTVKYKKYDGNKIISIIPHINGYKKLNQLSISNVDIFILSSAKVLNIPVLTDDPDMLNTAAEFEIPTIKSIYFLSYLSNHTVVDRDLLLGIFGYWEHIGDCPTGYHADLQNTLPEIHDALKILRKTITL